jgi:hypothetical protein|mmetsp:Transcript_109084/g.171947  ORF Transcript_109084/g.171947 Transcript_109084/m.171947 type:complete len:93 (-) Transcript_109084:1504-1782(-)
MRITKAARRTQSFQGQAASADGLLARQKSEDGLFLADLGVEGRWSTPMLQEETSMVLCMEEITGNSPVPIAFLNNLGDAEEVAKASAGVVDA